MGTREIDTGTEGLRAHVEDGIATLRIDRPGARGALTARMWAAIPDIVGRIAHDPEALVLVLTGSGGGHSVYGFIEKTGEAGNYWMSASAWHGNKKDPKWQAFNQTFTERYGHGVGEHEVEGYSAMYVVADALRRAASLDREAVKAALKETDIETIFGRITFQDFDGFINQNPGGLHNTEVAQWIDGELLTVWPKEYAQTDYVYPFPSR